MKKVLSFFIAGILFLSCCIGIQAALPESIEPLWDNIMDMRNTITFDGTEGTARGTLWGEDGTTEMSGSLKVYKETDRGWVFVASDSDSVTGDSMTLSVEFTGVSGGYYKSVFSVTVTRNGIEETETKTTYATC